MDATSDRIPLPRVVTELRQLTVQPLGYRALYNLVLDGRVPAEQGANGRWLIQRTDLPRIVAVVEAGPLRRALAA